MLVSQLRLQFTRFPASKVRALASALVIYAYLRLGPSLLVPRRIFRLKNCLSFPRQGIYYSQHSPAPWRRYKSSCVACHTELFLTKSTCLHNDKPPASFDPERYMEVIEIDPGALLGVLRPPKGHQIMNHFRQLHLICCSVIEEK